MVSEEDGGYVLVIKGEHKGKVGYFDDDELDCTCFDYSKKYTDEEMDEISDSCKCPMKAVVYFGTPFLSEYHLIPYDHLVMTDVTHLETKKFIKNFPEIAKQLGLCVE